MLAELGIYAVSIELGGFTKETQQFYIEDKVALAGLLIDNERWITESFGFLFSKVECSEKGVNSMLALNKELRQIKTTFECKNFGF